MPSSARNHIARGMMAAWGLNFSLTLAVVVSCAPQVLWLSVLRPIEDQGFVREDAGNFGEVWPRYPVPPGGTGLRDIHCPASSRSPYASCMAALANISLPAPFLVRLDYAEVSPQTDAVCIFARPLDARMGERFDSTWRRW